MAKLHGLIKLKRHELDEKRRILSELNKQLDTLYAMKQKLLDDLAHEKDLAAVDIDCARNFAAYLDRVLKRQKELDGAIRDKQHAVRAATMVVQDAYLDTKKVEITQEKRDEEEADAIAKKEADMLDEIALEGYRRNRSDDT